jgi:DNA-binding IclR family transcriptional regulator
MHDALSYSSKSKQGVQSVSKALELLCCFSTDHPEWGVTEIADYLGLCKSAAHRILATCEQFHFVVRTPDRRYRLGNRALELGNICRFDRRLLLKVEPVLRRLADETNSIAHLGELEGRDVLELARSAGPGSITFTSSPRFRGPAHATGMGKILLAFRGDEAFRDFVGPSQWFKRFTPFTIVSPQELKRELGHVAQRGYAISDQEAVLGCRCIAVPVRNRHRKFVAALSISNTPERFGDTAIPGLLSKLYTAADAIGRETPD